MTDITTKNLVTLTFTKEQAALIFNSLDIGVAQNKMQIAAQIQSVLNPPPEAEEPTPTAPAPEVPDAPATVSLGHPRGHWQS